ncbi:MAG: prepilin-type N-terminal cleavage/methylation domain-containing protein [Proteobacteria bacterium]|nr:prepilin-type N-terminal cleavage/methylation domain-containing protein [Pseudomonadota bacterium]
MKTLRIRQAGFTLVELLAGVSIAGVLSSIAYPSFESQIQKARRSDALVSMMQLQLAEERWRANSASYGSLSQIGMAATSAAGTYALEVSAPGADGYVALASAVGLQQRDVNCRYLKLTVDATTVTQASGPDNSVANAADANRRCWNQ